MPFPVPSWPLSILVLQTLGIVSALLVLPLLPPRDGRMLLIPVGSDSAARLAPTALATGARLIARGPFPGSLVVQGQRGPLSSALRAVLIVAAPQSGCGSAGSPA